MMRELESQHAILDSLTCGFLCSLIQVPKSAQLDLCIPEFPYISTLDLIPLLAIREQSSLFSTTKSLWLGHSRQAERLKNRIMTPDFHQDLKTDVLQRSFPPQKSQWLGRSRQAKRPRNRAMTSNCRQYLNIYVLQWPFIR